MGDPAFTPDETPPDPFLTKPEVNNIRDPGSMVSESGIPMDNLGKEFGERKVFGFR